MSLSPRSLCFGTKEKVGAFGQGFWRGTLMTRQGTWSRTPTPGFSIFFLKSFVLEHFSKNLHIWDQNLIYILSLFSELLGRGPTLQKPCPKAPTFSFVPKHKRQGLKVIDNAPGDVKPTPSFPLFFSWNPFYWSTFHKICIFGTKISFTYCCFFIGLVTFVKKKMSKTEIDPLS